MARGVGRALLAAMKNEAAAPALGPSSLFASVHRLRVFQYLSLHPCGSLSDAARALGVAPATVRFHALRLTAAGYLVESRRGFYPLGLIDPEDVPVFEMLASAVTRKVVAAVYARPGQGLTDLGKALGMTRQAVSSVLARFESHRLTTRVTDGRFVRVYPTRILEERQERHRARGRRFVDDLLRRLGADGEDPRILRRTSEICVVRLGGGPSKAVLELHLDPFASLLL